MEEVPETKNKYRWRKGGAAVMGALALGGLFTGQAMARAEGDSHLSNDCARYAKQNKLDKYQACVGYLLDLVGYNEFGEELSGSKIHFFALGRSGFFQDQRYGQAVFENNYYSWARQDIENMVAKWPIGAYYVDNNIHVTSTFINKAQNLAIIQSVEDWIVEDVYREMIYGAQLPYIYQETRQPHVTTMCKVPSGDGEKWVGVAEYSVLDFPCGDAPNSWPT